MKDSDIDYSDNPPLPAGFSKTAIFWPGRKRVAVGIDRDLVEFFRKTGKGYETAINGVLRRSMQSRKRRAG